MSKNIDMKKLTMIMAFYFILSYIIGPVIGYYFAGKTSDSLGNGFVMGSIVSIALWYLYGRNILNNKY